jgi:hypothetical protein
VILSESSLNMGACRTRWAPRSCPSTMAASVLIADGLRSGDVAAWLYLRERLIEIFSMLYFGDDATSSRRFVRCRSGLPSTSSCLSAQAPTMRYAGVLLEPGARIELATS